MPADNSCSSPQPSPQRRPSRAAPGRRTTRRDRVRLIVTFPPGGAADITGRLIGQWLSDQLGQPFVIENRPGGGTNIGTEAVATAAPDGYTLLVANAGNAINATLYRKLNFNFMRDLVPVAGLVRAPHVLFVAPSFPVKTVAELIAYAKANPGKINFASAGTGTANHIAGEMFKMLAGVDMVHVPYRGGAPAIADVLSGQVQVMFSDVLTMAAQMEVGKNSFARHRHQCQTADAARHPDRRRHRAGI